jgi:hypothetical protein
LQYTLAEFMACVQQRYLVEQAANVADEMPTP